MNIIAKNPYRSIGIFANSNLKDKAANISKIKAFTKVNKSISFPLDLSDILGVVDRTESGIIDADSKISRPIDQIKYAQFWFINASPLDKIAFNHLFAANIEEALSVWSKQDNLSSLQNRIVIYLIQKNYEQALLLSDLLYSNYSEQFFNLILGDNAIISSDNIFHQYLDALLDELPTNLLLKHIKNSDWRDYVSNKLVQPLISKINDEITLSNKRQKSDPKSSLNAANRLEKEAIEPLNELKTILGKNNDRYILIADKLALELLQCGIDYYNESDPLDAIKNALRIQKKALSIAIGKQAVERCRENVNILEDVYKTLPPQNVSNEHKAILMAMALFKLKPDLISHSIELIKKCAPHVLAIKEKLGKEHHYYLSISTQIVSSALYNIISEVNEVQEKKDFSILKTALISAWKAQLYMDKFDLEAEYKNGVYNENRNALYKIIDNCKGFEWPIPFLRYNCGWCNGIDVSDVDLRTDDELFESCRNLSDYNLYSQRYPSGKHIIEVKSKIEELRFQNCKTIADYQRFINTYPSSSLRPVAQKNMDKLKERIQRDNYLLASSSSTTRVIQLYNVEKSNGAEMEKYAQKALELAQTESDYTAIISAFAKSSSVVEKAKSRLNEMKEEHERLIIIIKKVIFLLLLIFLMILFFDSCNSKNSSYYNYDETATLDSIQEGPAEYSYYEAEPAVQKVRSQQEIDYETYINNQLKTGSKPYKKYYKSQSGRNYLDFNTSGSDYVIIVRDYNSNNVVNHVYIRANDRGRVYLPDGRFNIYFYGGKGWNPNMQNGNVIGGFVSNVHIQKDGPIEMYNNYGEYTLYPVENGNLQLQGSSISEAL